jgi:hypothetical protein
MPFENGSGGVAEKSSARRRSAAACITVTGGSQSMDGWIAMTFTF